METSPEKSGKDTAAGKASSVILSEKQMFGLLMEHMPDFIFFKDRHSRFIACSSAHAAVMGLKDPVQVIGKTDFDFFPQAQTYYDEEQQCMETRIPVILQERSVTTTSGNTMWIQEHKIPFTDEHGNVIGLMGLSRDITRNKELEKEKERVIDELNSSLEKINTLRGLIPICASCKKVRDDQGYWHQVETYIHEHTEANFSHGLCPDCAHRLYPDVTPKTTDQV